MSDYEIQIFKDPGFSASYNYTLDFPSVVEQNRYFESLNPFIVANPNYNKFPSSVDVVCDYEDAMTFSYLRWKRTSEVTGKARWIYGFITDFKVKSMNPGQTVISFDIVVDNWQTYLFDMILRPCNIQRAHVDRWSKDSSWPIRITPNTDSVSAVRKVVMDVKHIQRLGSYEYVFVWFAFIRHDGASNDSIEYCVFPILITSKEAVWLTACYSDLGAPQPFLSTSDLFDGNIASELGIAPQDMIGGGMLPPGSLIARNVGGSKPFTEIIMATTGIRLAVKDPDKVGHKACWISLEKFKGSLTYGISENCADLRPTKPTDLAIYNTYFEPALYMAPYTERNITDFVGTPILKVPDIVTFKAGNVNTVMIKYLISPGNSPIMVSVNRALIDEEAYSGGEGGAAIIQMPSIDIISDAWKTYVLTSRETDRAILANNLINQTASQSLSMGMGGGMVGSRGGGSGGPQTALLGASLGMISGGINAIFSLKNQDLKEEQIRNQPGNSLLSSNNSSLMLYGMSAIHSTVTQLDDITMKKASEAFMKFGYLINQVMDVNTKSRKLFNYIKTNGAIVEGAMPQQAKDAIANILDGGTTIWHMDYTTRDTIGKYDYENIERGLI